MNVLIVEEGPGFVTFVPRGLKAEGCRVTVANDGSTGSALACDDGVDRVVLDLELRKLSCKQVLAELRQARPDTPVVELTPRVQLEVHVGDLQRKLGTECIETVRGAGHRFVL